MENDYCSKCNRKSLRFSEVFGRWYCNKCKSVFTKDKIFVIVDPELKIQIRYNKDGSIKSIMPPTDLTLYNEVIDRQNRIIDFKQKLNQSYEWWNTLSEQEKIDVYEKNNPPFV